VTGGLIMKILGFLICRLTHLKNLQICDSGRKFACPVLWNTRYNFKPSTISWLMRVGLSY